MIFYLKLYKPVCDFGQSNYPESALNKEYNYVNDPHLLKYYQKRPQCVKLLQKLGKVDENGEVKQSFYNNDRNYDFKIQFQFNYSNVYYISMKYRAFK